MTIFFSKTTNGFYHDNEHSVIPPDAVEVSQSDYDLLLEAPLQGKEIQPNSEGYPISVSVTESAERIWAKYQAQVQILLNKSDIVALRCVKAGIIFPTDWLTYVADLRVIISASTGTPATLPTQPDYPAGT